MRKLTEEELHEIVRDHASHEKPVYDLQAALSLYRASDLKWPAAIYRISGSSRMRKAELVQAVAAAICDGAAIKEALLSMEQEEWDFFCRAAAVKDVVWESSLSFAYGLPERLGLLQSYYDDYDADSGKVLCVVPTEVREVFSRLLDSGIAQEWGAVDQLHRYIKAAANLYGVIYINELLDILDGWDIFEQGQERFFFALRIHASTGCEYFASDGILMHGQFKAAGIQDALDIMSEASGKPRYVPSEKEFLKYADPSYFERTSQVQALGLFLRQKLPGQFNQSEQLLEDLTIRASFGAPLHQQVSFAGQALGISDVSTLNVLAQLLVDVHNHTRIWLNKGHTPDELFVLYSPGGRRPTAVSRNAPCPCGSGKKYKRCCGRG